VSLRVTIKHLPGIHVYQDLDDRSDSIELPVYLEFRTPTSKNSYNNDEYIVDELNPWSTEDKETCVRISYQAAVALGLFLHP
jgi:hypothetical protein